MSDSTPPGVGYIGFVSYYTLGIVSSVENVKRLANEADAVRVTFDGGAYYEWSYEDERFFPEMGSPYLLTTLVPLRPITTGELLRIANHVDGGSIVFRYCKSKPTDLSLFSFVKTVSYVDYSTIVTELEKCGLVTVDRSTNILRMDDRRFTLVDNRDGPPELKKYVGTTYDVDVLGTTLFMELSKGIKYLYKATLNEED